MNAHDDDCVYDDDGTWTEHFEHDGRFWTVSASFVEVGTYSVTVSVQYVCRNHGLTSVSTEIECEGESADVVAHRIADDVRDGGWNETMFSDE